MTEHHARELRRALAEAADANRAVLALVSGARATLERVDLHEDLPVCGDVDTATRLLGIAENLGRSTGAILLTASTFATAATDGGAHD